MTTPIPTCSQCLSWLPYNRGSCDPTAPVLGRCVRAGEHRQAEQPACESICLNNRPPRLPQEGRSGSR